MSNQRDLLIKIAEKGGNDAHVLLLDKIMEMEAKMEEMEAMHENEMKTMEERVMEHMPMMKEMMEHLKTLAEKPAPTVNVPAPHIEVKAPVVNVQPANVKVSAPTVNVPPPTVNVHSETKKIEVDETTKEAILDLQEETKKLGEKIDKEVQTLKEGRPIFGPGKTKVYLKDLSASLDGSTKTFFIGSHFGITGVWGSSSPFAFRPTIDYIESGKNIVFDASIDAAVSLATGQTLIVQFLK